MELNNLWKQLIQRTDYERCERPRESRLSNQSARELLARMGNPQFSVPALHVAGSKGKGSVCQYLARALTAAGQRVGVYSSPHLSDWRERIQVAGQNPSDERLIEAIREVLDASDGSESFFDLLTAVAFRVFASSECTVQVIEVGLGGRFDSTNVLRPLASLVTSIEAEHADILGPSLAQIAWNKAGIFCEGSQAWAAHDFPAVVWPVLHEQAELAGCELRIAPGECAASQDIESAVMRANYALAHSVLAALDSQFPGAARALEQLPPSRKQLPGRFELRVAASGQQVIFDVAHSENSLVAALELFRRKYHDKQCGVLFALRDDKDANQLARALRARLGARPSNETWWVCPAADHPRSAAPATLATAFAAQPLSRPELPEEPQVVLVTGSTYLVGALRPNTHAHTEHERS